MHVTAFASAKKLPCTGYVARGGALLTHRIWRRFGHGRGDPVPFGARAPEGFSLFRGQLIIFMGGNITLVLLILLSGCRADTGRGFEASLQYHH